MRIMLKPAADFPILQAYLRYLNMKRVTALLVLFIAICYPALGALKVSLVTDDAPGRATSRGLQELRAALQARGIAVDDSKQIDSAGGDVVVVAGLSAGGGPAAKITSELSLSPFTQPESLLVHKWTRGQKPCLVVSGSDDRGLMYALLDVADRVGWAKDPGSPFSEVQDTKEKPDARFEMACGEFGNKEMKTGSRDEEERKSAAQNFVF